MSEKYVYIFHHTDLDGMGVKVLGMLYAQEKGLPYKTIGCSYGRVNSEVCAAIKTINDVEEIIIGDISVNEETAERLDEVRKLGIPVRLRDHHEAAGWLNIYPWALVKEQDDDGVGRCGTWWLAQDEDMRPIANKLQSIIEAIDSWDTWRWKSVNNITAKQLNSLFSVLGEDEFTQYMLDRYNSAAPGECNDLIFTEKAQIMIDVHQRYLQSQVSLCEKFMYTMNLWTEISVHKPGAMRKTKETVKFNTGIVFLNSHMSEIGDALLDAHPEIDILMMVAFPGLISWRTQKDLPISLGRIAQRATGNGGGHPRASASNISFNQFKDMMTKFMGVIFSPKLDFSNLRSSWEREHWDNETSTTTK